MILALLLTGLGLAFLVMWAIVFTAGVMSSVREACDTYVRLNSDRIPPPPSAPSGRTTEPPESSLRRGTRHIGKTYGP